MTTPAEVVALIVAFLQPELVANGMSEQALSDDTDLRVAGLINSLRFVQLLGELELKLKFPIDLSGLDPARLTRLGDIARHVAAQS